MQFFPTIKQACVIGAIVLNAQAFAQSDHDDGHTHETTAPAQEQSRASDGIINVMCPVTTDEEVDPMFTTEYEGQTIGLCCRKCRTRFEEDPEAYLAELPMLQSVSMTTSVDESSHDDAQEHGHDEEQVEHDHDETAMDNHDEDSAGDHDEGEDHDHATDHGQSTSSGLSKLIAWIGKFHPPATHLPIGMLIGAALAEGLFMMTKRDLFKNAGTFCLVIAGFGAMGAVTLGWFNVGFAFVDDEWIQTVHRWLGTSTALLTLLSIAMLIRASKPDVKPSARLWYRVSLFAAAGMVGATGFFGGALVYGINHYAW
ncbi:MAG: hypothetical protein JKX70_03545 [Phycisphaerales bacterium]|nr:hypothetical protein [Phycisphaerales bacterium]